jgi:drug/metabolite transporter (DMT)-like permease
VAAGCALTGRSAAGATTSGNPLIGDCLALAGALLDTFYYVGAKRIRMLLPLPFFFFCLFAMGAVLLSLGLSLCGQAEWSTDAEHGIFGWLDSQWLWLQLVIFVVGEVGATINFVVVLRYVDALVVTVFLLMQPAAASLLEVLTIGLSAIPSAANLTASTAMLGGVGLLVYTSQTAREEIQSDAVLTKVERRGGDPMSPSAESPGTSPVFEEGDGKRRDAAWR